MVDFVAGLGAAGYAASAAAAASGVGIGLFGYARGNYAMDQKLHYSRFAAANNLAVAQAKQYREDIADIANLTGGRMEMYHKSCDMGLTILTALFCPGRLGLHTSPPPGWLMGLFFGNLGACYLWLTLGIWLALHATLRSDVSLTHTLTRFVRLPVPSTWSMDRARKFYSSFEEVPWNEVFRIPFTKHSLLPGTVKNPGGYNEEMEVDPQVERRTRHGYDVPAWYRKEKGIDHSYPVETMIPFSSREGTAPEHFEAFREVQNEFWPYDVYARISMFLAQMHLLHTWAYHDMAHQFQEVRALGAAIITALAYFVAMNIVLTLDVAPVGPGALPLHRLGPIGLIFAFIAAALEYQRFYSNAGLAVCIFCVYCAYLCHIVYTIQLLVICAPSSGKGEGLDAAGQAWWPGTWKLPVAFQHAVWLVAPPRNLDEGQNDIVGEMREASAAPESVAMPLEAEKRQDVHRALGRSGEAPAWKNVQVGLIACLIAWIFLTFGWTIDAINQGTVHPSLLSAPGLPNNARDPRYRPPKPGKLHPVEVGTGGEHGPKMGERGGHRRLEASADVALAEKVQALLPYLQDLASSSSAVASQPDLTASLREHSVDWPALFEPHLLVSRSGTDNGHTALALSRQGRAISLTLPAKESVGAATVVKTAVYVLEGVVGHGGLLAASWDSLGLLLLTETGSIIDCPGEASSNGRWRCSALKDAMFPLGQSAQPFAGVVALTRQPSDGSMRAAVVFPGETNVAMFNRPGSPSAPWLPTGGARVGHKVVAASFAPAADELLLVASNGAVTKVHTADGRISSASVATADKAGGHIFKAAYSPAAGDIVRLALPADGAPNLKAVLLRDA